MSHSEPGPRNTEPAVYALVLAAGSGTRFGGTKLLAPLHGRPLVAYAATAVAEAIAAKTLAGGVAVIPPAASALAGQLEAAGLEPIENADAASGLAGSLRLGLHRLAELTAPPAGGAVIVLADQPALRADVLAGLVQAWRRDGRSARPRYRDRPLEPGHPVLLDRALWPLAAGLQGDTGFRDLLDHTPLTLVHVAGANPDVDTPDDLDRLEQDS